MKKFLPVNRMIIPKIKVSAPLSFQKVGSDRQMPMPSSPDVVAYYDFSLFPGLGGKIGEYGNAILSGHVDSGFEACDYGKTPPPCMAVLWDLDKLTRDDEVEVFLKGERYLYKVIFNDQVKENSKAWIKAILSTNTESVTILTCSGNFNVKERNYSNRQIVRAVRIRR
jgi:hypothetical protein